MDFHFVLPAEEKPKKRSTQFDFLKKFIPVFGLAAILPFMLFFVVNSTNLQFESSANLSNEIRIWIDPPEVIVQPGETIIANVVASVPFDKPIVYDVNTTLSADSGIFVTPTNILYTKPFNGQVVIGTIQITTTSSGRYNISLPLEKISTNDPAININTAGMIINVE